MYFSENVCFLPRSISLHTHTHTQSLQPGSVSWEGSCAIPTPLFGICLIMFLKSAVVCPMME